MMRLIDLYAYRLKSGKPEFLLLRRSPGVIYEGQWRMIGGKVGPHEKSADAALRELREETGIIPLRFWCVPSVNNFFDFKSDTFHQIPVFSTELPHQEPKLNHEHDHYGWFDADEAAQKLMWPEQQRLIRLINDILTERSICKEWIIQENLS